MPPFVLFSGKTEYKKRKAIFMKFLELRQKDVINCNTGEKLGFVIDLDFEVKTGLICYLLVPKAVKVINCFGKNQVYKIPYKCVVRIGKDAVLVDINEKECLK